MVGIWLVQRRGVRHSHVCCETAFGSVIISILVSERQKTRCFGEKCPSCSGVTGVHILQTRYRVSCAHPSLCFTIDTGMAYVMGIKWGEMQKIK